MVQMFGLNTYLLALIQIVLFLLFFIAFTSNIISIILAVLFIFLSIIIILFYFNLELIPLLMFLVVLGALLVLVIFSLFILNQRYKSASYSTLYYIIMACLYGKFAFFITNLKFYSFSQIWLYNQVFEKESLMPLYVFQEEGALLLVIGMLLLAVTIGISQIFKKY